MKFDKDGRLRVYVEGVTISGSGGGSGDVSGPSSSTDNAVVRYDGTTGKIIKNSNAILSNLGSLALSGTLTLNSGINQYTFPTSDSVSGSLLTTDGSGQLTFVSKSFEDNLGGIYGIELVTSTGRAKYTTIGAALSAAVAGNSVIVGPGVYNESITIPDGVTLKGYDNSQNVVISGSSAGGTRITIGNSVTLRDITVVLPNDTSSAMLFTGSTTSVLRTVFFQGNGASSTGLLVSGSGQVIVSECVYTRGDAKNILSVEYGQIIANTMIILSGTVDTFVNVSSSHNIIPASVVANNLVSLGQAATVTCGFKINSAAGAAEPSVFASNVNFENVTNGVYMRSDNSRAEIRSSRIDNSTNYILVDTAVTGGILHLVGCELERENINAPDGWLTTADYIAIFQDDKAGDRGFIIQGELGVGMPEKGHESVFGEGDSYTRGMKILTSDSTATSTTEGANITDVSVSGSGKNDGLSFGFQGTATNNTIMFSSTLSTDADKLKHFGIKSSQITAANEIIEKSFVFEVWDGTQWSEINVLDTHSTEYYPYSNNVFIRANSNEHIRFGIDNNTTWTKKTISGISAYWSRIRISASLTTAPTFDQVKLSTNRFEANADGTNTYHGFSRFRQTVFSAGNVFGETGGVVAYNIAVGTGSIPTQSWTHNVKNSEFNGNGDAIYFQSLIPKGTDTSLPMNVLVSFTSNKDRAATAGVVFNCSVLPLGGQGIPIADPSGSVIPIERTLAQADRYDVRPAQVVTTTINELDQHKFQTMKFDGFDISNFYQGDPVLFRMEMDDDGPANANIRILSVNVSLAKWNHGDRI